METYVVKAYNYDGIFIMGPSRIELHYSIFHKIFPHVFKLSTMSLFEQNMWKTLMAICLIKQYKLTISASNGGEFCNVIEIESGHYLSINFKNNIDASNNFEYALCYDEINHHSYECYNYEELLNCFLLPILNSEAQKIGISFQSIYDVTDDNLLMVTAFSL
jgi:hypothetical protein